MQLDLTSLLVVSQIISVACGVMFALDSAHGRAPFAPWFAAAFLSSPVASIFYLLPNLGDGWLWAYPIGNAIATLTVSLTWVGARSVNGRSLPHLVALTVPACIAGMVLILKPLDGPWSGSLPFFLSFGAFSALSAAEFWHGGVEEPRLRHSTVLAIICGVNACWFFTRALGLLTLGSTDPVFLMALGTESTTILLLVMIVGASLSLIAIGRERALNLAQTLATQDALTGLLNRGAFVRQAEALSRAAGKRQTSYALLLFDLDHFKAINDTHGHLIGDEVLVAFASAARAALRKEDLLCRFGGEEFAALLPGTTAEEAFIIAERIGRDFAESKEGVLWRVRPTTSTGIAACRAANVPLFELLEQADQALYQAKKEGRNRTAVYSKTLTIKGDNDTEAGPVSRRAACG